jgi:catechol 2,3-dioxygenase-like lactoylglutathione lyase family enzyme
MTVSTVNLGARDPQELARFWCDLLGYHVVVDEPGFILMRPPGPGVSLSASLESGHVSPGWPAGEGEQQMQLHLEVLVDDLEASVAYALRCGAVLAEQQPQDDVRVLLDPAGHPFCLWVET